MSTIYVSSTFHDLREHRLAVSTAIRRLGHVDVAMEYYVAEDARPLERCSRDASSCDLYLGIFARRYGYCPFGSELSITELELRAAQAKGIDQLCFLLADDAPWPDAKVETGVGAEKLAKLSKELSERSLCGYFSAPQELAAIASAAIVRTLDLGRTPFDAEREHRLMKAWQSVRSLPQERVRAGQALANMGSARYVAAIKELVLDANTRNDVAGIGEYLDQLQRLAASRRELMPIFLDLLDHEDPERRYFAVFQLGEVALRGVDLAPPILEQLIKRRTDPAVDVRAQLAHALGKLTAHDAAHAPVGEALQELRTDQAAEVREQVERSLRKRVDGG